VPAYAYNKDTISTSSSPKQGVANITEVPFVAVYSEFISLIPLI
jgi:hypothetical protein